jgi:hypothetical protein
VIKLTVRIQVYQNTMDRLYNSCIDTMEKQGYLIPKDQVTQLRQEMETLEFIVNDDDFDGYLRK